MSLLSSSPINASCCQAVIYTRCVSIPTGWQNGFWQTCKTVQTRPLKQRHLKAHCNIDVRNNVAECRLWIFYDYAFSLTHTHSLVDTHIPYLTVRVMKCWTTTTEGSSFCTFASYPTHNETKKVTASFLVIQPNIWLQYSNMWPEYIFCTVQGSFLHLWPYTLGMDAFFTTMFYEREIPFIKSRCCEETAFCSCSQ